MRVCSTCKLRHPATDGRTTCVVDGGALVDELDPRIGTVLAGRYVIEALIGEGGMASVYRARHKVVDRPFAVKILRGHLARDPNQRERLAREGRTAAALTHPNIVEIYDLGTTDDGAPYLVMELLSDGSTLRAMLDAGPLDIGTAIEIAAQIATGLARAHDFGVVHRDLKPENVFVLNRAPEGLLVKIVDFGIARAHQDTHLTAVGEIVGTPQYLAPERATSRDAGPSSDLYSLGVVLFEMVTGQRPFEGLPTAVVLRHMYEAPPAPRALAPHCPPVLDALILALLQKSPADRPVDAHRVVELLAALRTSQPIDRPSWTAPERRAAVSNVDAWAARLGSLRAEIERRGSPSALLGALGELEAAFDRIRRLRDDAWHAQLALDELEKERREGSERLGHAVHELAVDLSRARETERAARAEAELHFARALAARAEYRAHLQRLVKSVAIEAPEPRVLEETRAAAAAIEAWTLADGEARAADARAAEAERANGDLGFQIDELRKGLRILEQSVLSRARGSQQAVAAAGVEQRAIEHWMIEAADRIGAMLAAPDVLTA